MAPNLSGATGRSNVTVGHVWSKKKAVLRQVRGIAVMLPDASSDMGTRDAEPAAHVRQPASTIRISTLGQFRVLVRGAPGGEDRPVVWSTAQARQLLKCLIASPGYQRSRDELIELLWAEQALERAGSVESCPDAPAADTRSWTPSL